MARPRTPSHVLELRGAFTKNPQRARDRDLEPKPKAGIGSAPEFLSRDERASWNYLVRIAPRGVLGDSDRAYLEIAAELFSLKRSVGIERMEPAKLNRLETMLGKLGLGGNLTLRT